MKFLLIDFGASFIKTSIYDTSNKTFNEYKETVSPFLNEDKIEIDRIINLLRYLVESYDSYDYILSCSIKNSSVINHELVTWKLLNQNHDYKRESVIGCLFLNQPTYHLHKDHDISSSFSTISILGYLFEKTFLSCLGDTDCVKRSINLSDDSVLINLGTGSQIITNHEIKSFFPSGRMFLTFERFFKSMNCDFFEELHKIKLSDILNSTLEFDLSVFKQARNFIDFGSIKNIEENNFNKTNFLASLLKGYVDQYIAEIDLTSIDKIFLSGGISQKLKVISEYFSYKTSKKISLITSKIPETHLGMSNMIESYLILK